MKFPHEKKKRITTAVLLAAGTGSRLYPLTQKEPKCLTMVDGSPILERLISNLNTNGFKKLIIVTGHLEDCIRNFLGSRSGNIKIEYIFSPLYKTTNNIYSLWMARKKIKESFLLVDSDLVFDESLLSGMIYPGKIAAAFMHPGLNGTCVTFDHNDKVEAFLPGDAECFGRNKYKTVNIYSISFTSWSKILKRLNEFIEDGKVNDYYEKVFADLVAENQLSFEKVSFDDKPWYEIDNLEDLEIAEKLFKSQKKRTRKPVNIPGIIKSPISILNAAVISPNTTGRLNAAK